MATKSMTVFTVNGTDYTINDPNIAVEFSAAAAYSKGDYVYYQGNLYVLTADHAANTTWENTSKQQVLVSTMLKNGSVDSFHLTLDGSVRITAGADLNDYSTPGNYHVLNSSDSQNIDNMPEREPGKLIVMYAATQNDVQQLYYANSGYLYYRKKDQYGWHEWQRYAYFSDLQKDISTIVSRYTQIAENTDFNDLNTPGEYVVTTSSIVPTLAHVPEIATGKLIVMESATTADLMQIYITVSNNIYSRTKNASGWGNWHAYTYFSELKKDVSTVFERYTQLVANTDFNSLTDPGEYVVKSSALVPTLVHIPESATGKLIVMESATTADLMQIYITVSNNIYTRIKNANGWGDWKNLIAKTSEDKTREQAAERGLNNRILALMQLSDYSLTFANAPVQLNLKNYLGNTQNVHPKVLYFPNKFGGYYYWMAYTPYPNGVDDYENPSIAYSNDGYEWTNISGNPIDEPTDNSYYLSDPHLVYRNDTGVLECWYRAVVTVSGGRTEKIYRQTTTNGTTWSNKELIYETGGLSAARVLSPAVIWDGQKYCIWVVDNGVITYYEALPGSISTWTLVRRYTLTFTDSGTEVNAWHLDVIRDGDNYLMVVMTMNGDATGRARKYSLFYTTSADNINYSTPAKIINGSNNWDNLLYRSSVVKIGSLYRIYYSALSYANIFGLGITQGNEINKLYGYYM